MDLDRTLVNNLLNPDFYPHKTNNISLIETHSSWVILTGDLVYKIKKPVNFGFLDFSTLEKRKTFCYKELELNSRFSKTIYLKVIPIYGTIEKPSLEDNGKIIEYLMVAKQFTQDCLLSNLEQNNKLTLHHIKQISAKLAKFHLNTENNPPNNNLGDYKLLKQAADDNFLVCKAILKDKYTNYGIDKLHDWSNNKFSVLKTCLASRLKQGFVRNCHGDLHLENMVLLDEVVTFFDCIEFNEEFRWIDIINDVAFVIMDLISRNHYKFAFALLNNYLEITGDYSGLKLLDLFINYRAMVKAKVALLDLKHDLEKFNRFICAAKYSAQLQNKMIILMHGISGSGKSYISEGLVKELHAIRIRSDVERKRLHKDNANISLYSKEMDKITFSYLLNLVNNILDAGFSVIVDATFLSQISREPFITLASERQLPVIILAVQANYETIKKRIKKRIDENIDMSDADLSVVDMQLSKLEKFSDYENDILVNIDANTGNIDWEKIVTDIKALSKI